jgi:HEPN domain-containing protein
MLTLIRLLRSGDMDVQIGDETIDISNPADHVRKEWFKALYGTVERWYEARYGVQRVSGEDRRNDRLRGAVLFRGEPYPVLIPINRRKVEIEGEQAWMYFDEGLGEGEDALGWIANAPSLQGLGLEARDLLRQQTETVASTLRFVEFRRVTGGKYEREPRAQEMIEATLVYLQQAAKRMVDGDKRERVMGWYDLQMACESALKAAICQATGDHPHIHPLQSLIEKAESHGVEFDVDRLASWHSVKAMSDFRYGRGHPGNMGAFYDSYVLALDLARAAIDTIQPGFKSGFGVLLQYPPWKSRPTD